MRSDTTSPLSTSLHTVDDSIKLIPTGDDQKCKLLFTHFPIAYWLPNYKIKSYLSDDIIAGLTAGIMLIPQGMGYSLIASLDPIYGLYASMFGPLLYALFGTSGQLSVAPVAVVSLMTGEALESIIHAYDLEDGAKIAIASCIAFQVGLIQLCIGLLNGGVIANLLSHSVTLGFTCAAAILIGLSQIKHIFQIQVDRGEIIQVLKSLFSNIGDTHWQSVVLSVCCIIFLSLLKVWKRSKKAVWGQKYAQFVPGPLIVVVVSTFIVWLSDNSAGFHIINEIQNGLPKVSNFFVELENIEIFWNLWTTSLMISLIAFIESYAVAHKFAEQRGYHINASQELIANGIPNLVASFFQIYPITGGLSRTAVVDAAGGKTPLNSLISGLFMLIALGFLLSLFKYLPFCVLASIIMVSVSGLFDYSAMIHLWHIKHKDFYVSFITFIITLFVGVEIGVAVGVVVSILVFIERATIPHYAVLGKVSSTVYRNIKNYENAQIRDDILIIRWDASLFFANIATFRAKVTKQIKRKKEQRIDGFWCLVLCFSGINDIDATAAHSLYSFVNELQQKYEQLTIVVSNTKKPVMTVLRKVKFIELIGESKVFFQISEAVLWWDDVVKEYAPNSLLRKSADYVAEEKDDNDIINDIAISTEFPLLKQNDDNSDKDA